MCQVLGASRSGYYAWCKRPKSKQETEREQLLKEIIDSYIESQRIYGSRRITKDLHRQKIPCSRNRVARIMTQEGMQSIRKRRFKVTTDSKHNYPVADNLLADAKTTVTAPDQALVSDITYIPTDEGWLYLASCVDFCSKKAKGWAMSNRIDRELTLQALRMAAGRCAKTAGIIHHSDRGSQYACYDYRDQLDQYGMICSMSRKGNCYDNAWSESFNATVKLECVYQHHFKTRRQARQCLFEYIEIFYNRRRLHSSIGYLPPDEYEQLYRLSSAA
jgi:putative transposase